MALKIRFSRVLATGIVFAFVAQIMNTFGAFLTMPYYLMTEYFPVWSKIMMPSAGPPPMSFYLLGFLFSFLTGILFALGYGLVRPSLPRSFWTRGITYGLLVFVVGAIPGHLVLILLINIPLGLVAAWALTGLVINLVSGLFTAFINK